MSDKIKRLYDEFGQSMWYDNISRDLLDGGEIQALVDRGIRGLTSNPSIFQKAITGGTAYDAQLSELAQGQPDAVAVYEALAIKDIRAAADMLRPIYEESGGTDGFVSLEVSPLLANDEQGTVDEAARLYEAVDRPNLLVKIPATDEGLGAIEESIANGLSINVTLLFSTEMYERVMDAYIRGLQRRAEAGQPVSGIASVASFFVSRVDTLVDDLLDEKIDQASDAASREKLEALKGKAGIANARLAYQLFREKFSSPPFTGLADEHGAHLQRVLWASTSTKNPAYPDTLYVDNLIGPDSVNTAPPETIEAFTEHGVLARTVDEGVDEARQVIDDLADVGIDMDDVTDQLLREGVEKFAKPFNSLIASIEEKVKTITGTTVR